MVLGSGEWEHMGSISKRKKAQLFPFEKLLDNDSLPRAAKSSAKHRLYCFIGPLTRFGNDHAFALRKAIGLDDDGEGQGRCEFLGA